MKKKDDDHEHFYDECPIVGRDFTDQQQGLYRLNGMCWVLDKFPELRKACPVCKYYKEIPPNSYSCRRFYCTFDKE